MSAHKFTYTVRLNETVWLGDTLEDVRAQFPFLDSCCDDCGSPALDPDDDGFGFTMIKVGSASPVWSRHGRRGSGYAVRCANPECGAVTPILRKQRFDD